ncbi:Acetyl esterase/lipase [Friedmanniella luteola]|uniref:Acetyl esterase/lipase n=1 Tax=Friedmanniella luteola TaxID=546871 RepID=A0A1H1SN24_9ACTN|nr:alpha/beta hydrolase [Friedmanniella luteola]SDS49238.1 Acetyl esterase/lipase [Friedmanniella luteola]
MTVRTVARALGAVTALSAAAALLRTGVRRYRLVSTVPAELRHPMLYLPVTFGPPVLWLVRRATPRPAALAEGTTAVRRTVPGRDGHPPVDVWVYEAAGRRRPSGVLLWVHGGGFVLGDPVSYHDVCSRYARELGVAVVSVDYRLAPEHPFPAGLEDCYTALRWLQTSAAELGVDPTRIAVGGDSAGGGLAATLAQLALDRAEVAVCFQLLVYPMLDDRTVLRDDDGTGRLVWTPTSNRFGWTSYLGHPPAAEEDRPYAAGARRVDLRGLPPAWIGVGDVDLFHAEDVAYAARLRAAGVPCELHVAPGLYHGADGFREARAEVARDFRRRTVDALRPAIGSSTPG